MSAGEGNRDAYEDPPILMTQALVVTAGPLAGRICENDDDDFMFASDFAFWELEWIEDAGVEWRKPVKDPDLPDEEGDDEYYGSDGVDCEIVTFGRYLQCDGHYRIPRQFLRPATIDDLIRRHKEIGEIVFRRAYRAGGKKISGDELSNLLIEQSFVADEIWSREMKMAKEGGEKNVFLCHASADKPTVRKVCSDLTEAGHKVWMDEFEIAVGESIVEKITQATDKADALVLFISEAAVSSDWVKREWQSTLSRQLAGQPVVILPAVIEDCQHPSLLSDIKYADFRPSYHAGLDDLLTALSKISNSRKVG